MARFLLILCCLLWCGLAHAGASVLVLVGDDPIQQALHTELALDPSIEAERVSEPDGFAQAPAATQAEVVRTLAAQTEHPVVAWVEPATRTLFLWSPGDGRDRILTVKAETDEPGPELALVARSQLLEPEAAPAPEPPPVAAADVPEELPVEVPPADPTQAGWWLWSGGRVVGGGLLRAGGSLGVGFGRTVQLRAELGSQRPFQGPVSVGWDGSLGVWLRHPGERWTAGLGLQGELRSRNAVLAAADGPTLRYQWWRPGWGPQAEAGVGRSMRLVAHGGASFGDRARIWQEESGEVALSSPVVQWLAGLRLAVWIE